MLYVDRIEEGQVVCQDEDERVLVLSPEQLDAPVHEGDCLVSAGDGRFRVDEAATQARRKRLAKRYRSLFERQTK